MSGYIEAVLSHNSEQPGANTKSPVKVSDGLRRFMEARRAMDGYT